MADGESGLGLSRQGLLGGGAQAGRPRLEQGSVSRVGRPASYLAPHRGGGPRELCVSGAGTISSGDVSDDAIDDAVATAMSSPDYITYC